MDNVFKYTVFFLDVTPKAFDLLEPYPVQFEGSLLSFFKAIKSDKDLGKLQLNKEFDSSMKICSQKLI